MNPDNPTNTNNGFLLPPKDKGGRLQPLPNNPDGLDPAPASTQTGAVNPTADIIRQKLEALYEDEPNAKEELVEAKEAGAHRSKHQAFMYKLSTSGKSLADIQTAWHNYYLALPDDQKHQVWQEFYQLHGSDSHPAQVATRHADKAEPNDEEPAAHRRPAKRSTSVADIKKQLVDHIGMRGKLKPKHHLQSLVFGLGMGSLVVLVLLLGFFNERFIAPFISPSRNVSATPIIIDPNSPVAGPDSKIIIPKINVEIPVVYDQSSIDEKAVQKSLENGVVHYATTPSPGELGNAVIVGHSSNNILNKGHYKFAFVLLSRLSAGDTFYLTKDGKRYVYKIYDKRIIDPTDVSVLGSGDKPATVTLITCDPPGTSLHRLIVVGEQITPDPSVNVASTAVKNEGAPKVLPGNAPSLWQRLKEWLTS